MSRILGQPQKKGRAEPGEALLPESGPEFGSGITRIAKEGSNLPGIASESLCGWIFTFLQPVKNFFGVRLETPPDQSGGIGCG
jgi:hypothetical protein